MVAERRNRAEECKANKEEWEDKPVSLAVRAHMIVSHSDYHTE